VIDVIAGPDPVLRARLAKGIFAKPSCYPTTVRFGNSDPQVNSDQKPDVRSLSFFVDLTKGGSEVPAHGVPRQDFSLQNTSTLPINDARALVATMKVLTAATGGAVPGATCPVWATTTWTQAGAAITSAAATMEMIRISSSSDCCLL
jgi:hypothetical protein